MAQSDLGRKSADILLTLPVELKERMVNTITWTRPYNRHRPPAEVHP
ncbi:hypothetical protein ABFW14_04705 [Mycolicibacterium fortuitum]